MKVTATAVEGVMVVEAVVHRDDRGFFVETWHAARFGAAGLPTAFVQDNYSRSVRHTLRGLHYQVRQPQGKLVGVATGTVFDVAVDLRRSSPTFKRWVGVELSDASGRQLWVPPGCAHGFYVLSAQADVTYKCTALYSAADDRTLRWDDPELAIAWPLTDGSPPRLSAKDAGAPLLREIEPYA